MGLLIILYCSCYLGCHDDDDGGGGGGGGGLGRLFQYWIQSLGALAP